MQVLGEEIDHPISHPQALVGDSVIGEIMPKSKGMVELSLVCAESDDRSSQLLSDVVKRGRLSEGDSSLQSFFAFFVMERFSHLRLHTPRKISPALCFVPCVVLARRIRTSMWCPADPKGNVAQNFGFRLSRKAVSRSFSLSA